ncbi:uncharacterized protein LOC144742541 [Ciona intestinalis]
MLTAETHLVVIAAHVDQATPEMDILALASHAQSSAFLAMQQPYLLMWMNSQLVVVSLIVAMMDMSWLERMKLFVNHLVLGQVLLPVVLTSMNVLWMLVVILKQLVQTLLEVSTVLVTKNTLVMESTAH